MRKLNSVFVVLSFMLFLISCGGGGGGNTNTDTNTNTVASPASVIGVFSVEQPIANADITLKDANGTVKTTVTDVNGVYYIDTSGLTPPFVIKGSYTSASVPYTYYSYLAGDFSSTDNVKANINEFTTIATTLLVAQSGNGNNPDTLFSETDANRTTILNTDISQALTTLTNLVCPVLLSDDQQTSVGCNFVDGENFVNMVYAADPTVNDIEKLAMLIDVSIDPASGDLIARDSSGTTLTIITMDNILNGTIPVDQTITLDVAIQINNLLATLGKQDPLLNETLTTQLSSGNTVASKVEYVSIFPNADLQIHNLTECPAEIRNIKVNYTNPADNLNTPSIPFVNHTPLIDTVVPEATLSPVDACKRFSFSYEYEHNLVIRKTQTGLVDGVPVWEYDVPACEQYSNKVVEGLLEETYKYTDADFDLLFNRPVIEVRPELHHQSGSWPDSSVTFVFDSTCPMAAEFSVSPIEGTGPLTVNVDASSSIGNIVSYQWETTGGQTATGETASFIFTDPLTYTITLTVTDTNGQTDSLSKTVIVDSLPQAAFTSTLGSAEFQMKLNAVNSTGTGISYKWSTSDGKTATGQNVNFTFASAGDYTVTLVVTDKYGNTSTKSKVVTVKADVLPQAAFTWALTSTTLQAGFDASSSTGVGINSYEWTASDSQTAIGQTTNITFSSGGSYTVTLKITDQNGKTSSVSKTVVIPEPECYAGQTDSQSCAITNGTGTQARSCTNGKWDIYSACTVSSCNTGYDISNNSCVIIEYSLVGNWCRSDNRMCIDILPSTDYAIVTSFSSSVYSSYNVQVGETKYQNINKTAPNEYSADSKTWQTDGTFYWSGKTLKIANDGTVLDAGSISWYKQ